MWETNIFNSLAIEEMLYRKHSPTADTSINSESGTALVGMSSVTFVEKVPEILRSTKTALFLYCVSPSG